ncbi:MAG: hypothetical protein HOO67_07055 [Candidatus Peribacteraceae bacterium]|nr:hypothetical protein [Candidatus Peribacteraceae bacterium]
MTKSIESYRTERILIQPADIPPNKVRLVQSLLDLIESQSWEKVRGTVMGTLDLFNIPYTAIEQEREGYVHDEQ